MMGMTILTRRPGRGYIADWFVSIAWVTFVTAFGDSSFVEYVKLHGAFTQIRCAFARNDHREHSRAGCRAMPRES